MASLNMSERDGKDQGEDSPKQTCCAGSLTITIVDQSSHKWRKIVSSGCFLFADAILLFSGVIGHFLCC